MAYFSSAKMENTVCFVSGANGYIASHLVQQLLTKGYSVVGSVRNANDEQRTAHLKALAGSERLTLVEANLLNAASVREAVRGCHVVFHTASPFFNTATEEDAILQPAIEGTLAVLNACVDEGIKEVILTSSTAAIFGSKRGPDDVVDESHWSDEDMFREKNLIYPLSKTVAERKAWEWSKEQADKGNSVRLVTINPTLVVGPMLQPKLNTSSQVMADCFGKQDKIRSGYVTLIDVRDVAEAHVLAFENKNASGRYMLVSEAAAWKDITAAMSSALAGTGFESTLPTEVADPAHEAPDRYNQATQMKFSSDKVTKELGLKLRSAGESLADLATCSVFQNFLRRSLPQFTPASMRWRLDGQTALVTGGTKGIGEAIVEQLLDLGAQVVVSARTAEDVDACVQRWTDKYGAGRVLGHACDVSTQEGRTSLQSFVHNNIGQCLDILINNVGTNIRKATTEYTDEEVDHILNTNLLSFFHLTRMLHGLLKRAPTASVVLVGSVAGHHGIKSGVPYAMTKAAMEQATRNWACEWASDGIRVNCIAPWYINTPLAKQVLADPAYKARVVGLTPLNRVGETSEVATAAAFMCMPASSYMTGQTLTVDGGFACKGFY